MRTRSLRSDQIVSDIDQRVRPKSMHSCLFLNASSHVLQPYHFSHHSDQSYHRNFTIKTVRTCFCQKENRNKHFMSKDGPTRSKMRLQAHLRSFKNELVDTMAVYVFIKTNIKISFRRKNVKFPRINKKIVKDRISPFFT